MRACCTTGNDITASILIASLPLQLKVPVIWVKALDERHGAVLDQLGVHKVVYPEKDMGRRVAHLERGAAADYLEIDKGCAIIKKVAPPYLQGRTLADLSVRSTHGVTIAAHRPTDADWQNTVTDTVLGEGDMILVVGPIAKVEKFAQLR